MSPRMVALGAALLAASTLVPKPHTAQAAELPSFAELLARAGLEREDLEVGGPPDFLGHPLPSTVPFLLPHVEAVRRDPLHLVALGESLLAAARAEGTNLRGRGDREAASGRLLPVLTAFLLQPRQPAAFRGFAPAAPPPAPATPSLQGAEELPERLRASLGPVVDAALRSADRVERSWRRVPEETLATALATPEVARLGSEHEDAWRALEDAARHGDDIERAGAFVRLVLAVEGAARELEAIEPPPDFDRWEMATPHGRVIVAGPGDHEHVCRHDCLLLIDLGGDDVYRGTAAGAGYPEQSVAVVLDLEGDDRYEVAAGAGVGGLGVLADLAGNDLYTAGDRAQGFGLLGYGLLWDRDGRDRYRAAGGAQGAALFGGGLLLDEGGRDEYRVLGEGQGFGGPGGAGALVDRAGDDAYTAEPDPRIARGRADYHSRGRVAANHAQGAGVGRRGDLSDGRAWAGGLGVLADLDGDDTYAAGNFAQGVGFWWGTGMLLDAAGDDAYRSVYFSQGAGAHFSLALLYDRAGADRHRLEQEAAAGLGYGWDFAASVFLDGGGEDHYAGENTALGVAERSSVALFLELGGDDDYRLPSPDGHGIRTFGAVDDPASDGPLRAAAWANQVALFLDLDGTDRYPQPADESFSATPGETRGWRWPVPADPATDQRKILRGVGLDLAAEIPAHAPEHLGAWLTGLLTGPSPSE